MIHQTGYVVLLYDYFLTLPDEVRLIWPTSWSLVKILFLINRYTVPIFLTWGFEGAFGHSKYRVGQTPIGTDGIKVVSIAGIEAKLNTHKYPVVAEGGYLKSPTAVTSPCFIRALPQNPCFPRHILHIDICFYPLNGNTGFEASDAASCLGCTGKCCVSLIEAAPLTLLAQLGFEIVIFGMTLYKCLEHAKSQQLQTPLLHTLYRDGFLYFLVRKDAGKSHSVGPVIRILNLALWIVAPPSLIYLGLYFIWSLITLLISRLLLNLRNVSSYSQWQAETNVRGLNNMQFAPRSDLDAVPNKTTTTTTGYTNSTRLTDVLEWLEEEGKEEGWAEERRAGKRRQMEPDIEVVEHEEDVEMGPVRRGTRRHFVEENGSGPAETR
ncbi:hypothetical protein FRC10_003818 [Ceratobasidium sp. 414]|nr:hypothetical protein FRC10_003818 [Ceratobasidium sp. 414]